MARILSLVALLFPARALAAASENADLFLSGLKMVAGTVLVVGTMLLIYILNKKGVQFLKRDGAKGINILETRSVGGGKALSIVEVRGRELLLGLGKDRIDFLCRLDDSRSVKKFEEELEARLGEKT